MGVENHIKENLLLLAKEYYDVFENNFLKYRRIEKHQIISFFSFFFLAFVLPVISLFTFFLLKNIKVKILTEYFDYFLGLLLTAIIVNISILIYYSIKSDRFKNEESIFRDSKISFCYLFRSFSLLEKYAESNIKDQLKEGKKSFEGYQFETHLKNKLEIEFLEGANEKKIDILKFSQKYTNKYFWFQLDNQSKKILESLKSTNEKIANRINEGFEIDIVLPILKNLLLFEYSTLNAEKTFVNGLVGDFSEDLLLDYVSELDKVSLPKREAKKKAKRTDSLKLSISGLFLNKNILISFISWFVILLFVFGAALILAQQYFSIPMDSKILIGLISAPFAGAIAISVALYTKK